MAANPFARFVQSPQPTEPDPYAQFVPHPQHDDTAQPQSGPWNRYASQSGAETAHGPWEKYAQAKQPNPFAEIVRNDLSRKFYAAQNAGDQDTAKQLIGEIQRQGMTLAPMTDAELHTSDARGAEQAVADTGGFDRFMAGAGKSVMDTARGIGQALGMDNGQDPNAVEDKALMQSGVAKAGDLAGQAAQMYVGGAGIGEALRGAGVAARALPYVTGALTSGAFSGAQPVQPGGSRLVNTAAGAGLGAAGAAVSPVLGAVGRRLAPVYSDAKQAALNTAARYNIPLHLTQVANSPFGKVLGSVTKYLPLSGSYAADAAQRQAWNRALASTIGQDATELTPDVMNAARSANGAGYDALFGRNTVNVDDDAINALSDLQQRAHSDPTPEQAGVVDRQIDKYLDAAGGNDGAIAGRRYQNIRQELLNLERGNQPSAFHVRQVRHAMEDAAERSMGPQDTAELQGLNAQYKNIKALGKGLAQNGGANNTIAPANLWRLTQGRFGGTPELQALGRLGQTVLKDPIHDSGTAQRMLAHRLLGNYGPIGAAGLGDAFTNIPHLLPAATGLGLTGATVGRFMNSPAAARMLPNAVPGMFNMLSRVPAQYLLPLMQTGPQQ